jgi:hypothetical protein
VPSDALSPRTRSAPTGEILAGRPPCTRSCAAQWANYNLNEVTTDEQVVPTRGSDWFDNGRWLEIHRQGGRRTAARRSTT